MKIAYAVLSLCLCLGLTYNYHSYSPLSSEIAFHGRYYISNNSVAYDWACFNIDFCFSNSTKIVWEVVDSWNIYLVVLDRSTNRTIHPKKDTKIVVFESTKPESHCIEIIKIT